jgi:hypothetical protein
MKEVKKVFGNKIYACEDTLMVVSCFVCVGKENCNNYRIGSLEIEKEFDQLMKSEDKIDIGNIKDLQTTTKNSWIDAFNAQYDYKKNLEHLKERYLNKIHWYMERINTENEASYKGIIEGLSTAIHDIEDILDGLEV